VIYEPPNFVVFDKIVALAALFCCTAALSGSVWMFQQGLNSVRYTPTQGITAQLTRGYFISRPVDAPTGLAGRSALEIYRSRWKIYHARTYMWECRSLIYVKINKLLF